jgi:argininosuccinate lyase
MVARHLGFDGLVTNSIDAVSDRDYLIECVAACSITMMHLSRFAEELVLWCSQEFRFARIDDSYSTGSSIMPQKKNPDMAELVRGKTGRVFGDLMSLLTIMKGLPLAYNRDMQEDKIPMFDAVSTTRQCLFIFSHLMVHTTFSKERFEQELENDLVTATDLAEYLVRKGVAFREAHTATGKIVAAAVEQHMTLQQFTLKELQHYSKAVEEDVYDVLNARRSVEQKLSAGSTSPHEVKKQIVHWSRLLKNRIR